MTEHTPFSSFIKAQLASGFKFFFIALFGFFSYPCFSTNTLLDGIAVEINEEIILSSELERKTDLFLISVGDQKDELPPRSVIQKQLLEKLILEVIQKQIARKTGIEIDDLALDFEIQTLANHHHMNLNELKERIEHDGIPFSEYRESIRTELILARLQHRDIRQQINITPAEINAFLNSREGQDRTGIEYQLGHILLSLPDPATPKELKEKEHESKKLVQLLERGANFKEIAMAKSSDQNALAGGILNWRKLGEIPALFVKEIPQMHIGEVRGPFRSNSGFHLIKLLDKRSSSEGEEREIHVKQILIKPSTQASDEEIQNKLITLRAHIISGKDTFMNLATTHSDEFNTSPNGGDLGWITKKNTLPEFYAAIETLMPGELSAPFKTSMGWHLVQALETRVPNQSEDSLRNKAKEILAKRKYEEILSHWLKELRDNARVEIFNTLDTTQSNA